MSHLNAFGNCSCSKLHSAASLGRQVTCMCCWLGKWTLRQTWVLWRQSPGADSHIPNVARTLMYGMLVTLYQVTIPTWMVWDGVKMKIKPRKIQKESIRSSRCVPFSSRQGTPKYRQSRDPEFVFCFLFDFGHRFMVHVYT